MGMCADFAIHDTDGHNPHAHILLTVRPLNENGTWQYKTEKEYLCIKPNDSISIGLFLNKESLKKLAIHDMALIDFKKLSVNYLIDRGQGPWRGVNVCDSLTFIRNDNIYRRHSVKPLNLN